MIALLEYVPLLLKGAFVTLCAWIVAALLSFGVGTLLGIMSCRHLGFVWSTRIIKAYTFIAKGIPAYVQILIAYFVIPALLHINLPGMVAALGALIFCSSGYVTEIVRSGINAVAPGQWNACFVLGYSMKDTLMRIILPQTFKNVGSSLCGEFEQLLKSTSLLATIGITELTRTGMNIISRELNPIPIYLLIACIYVLFSGLLQLFVIGIEKKGGYGNR